jgi:uncharacterized protein YndB with AHSA1/START domain
MNRMIAVAPVRKSVRVQVSPARAFEVFTKSMSRWWPATHTILKVAPKEHIIEPRTGGRWYQVGVDGSQCDNGKVLAWEPPRRLLLAWQLNAEWQFDPGLVTEVEVPFIEEGAHATRVELEHRHLERMGEKAETVRASVDSAGGWGAILESYRAVADSVA